ncbi:hypothetical protein [Rhodoferax sp.]|uniref:hypothetical protein n=1 Tax=Rhodoferax sp. TaxID=50421 RepID=UPI0025F3A58D|nr:hypothetical protein [Rhodoferax sp.]MCM2340647.1 hypothetical protein [Rhodoferax sp.]
MYFRIFNNDASSELTYFLADLVACETVLIDPHGPDLSLRMALLAVRQLRLCWVLRTHLRSCPRQPQAAEPEVLRESVTLRVFTLPDETLLFAGHAQRARCQHRAGTAPLAPVFCGPDPRRIPGADGSVA